jgi:hypothetical protein
MELILNLAWALVSIGLVTFWLRGMRSNPAPRVAQALALSVVVLLLLPVISLSDDLVAAQTSAETDTCLRRALDCDCSHIAPASFALPEPIVTSVAISGFLLETLQTEHIPRISSIQTSALDSRPPPRA